MNVILSSDCFWNSQMALSDKIGEMWATKNKMNSCKFLMGNWWHAYLAAQDVESVGQIKFVALCCSLLELNTLFVLLTWNYCSFALLRYEGGNKGSSFKEGGQAGHSIQGGSNQLLQRKKDLMSCPCRLTCSTNINSAWAYPFKWIQGGK